MPKPATTHPTKRIAGAPTRTPTTTRTTSAAPPMISRPVGPAAATAAGWAAPSTASVSLPRSAGYFAASAGGAKERVAQGGGHRTGGPARGAGGCAATGPLTPASAPISGSPRNRQIPGGESAPVRLGREDPGNFGSGTLTVLGLAIGAGREQAAAVEPQIGDQASESLGHGGDGSQQHRRRGGVADRNAISREHRDQDRVGRADAEGQGRKDPGHLRRREHGDGL